MSDSGHYRIDESQIVSETIDGEAIIINLTNGYYYSLDPVAAEIWACIQKGYSVSEIVSALHLRYDCSQADPEPTVRALISAWSEDELIAAQSAPDALTVQEPNIAPTAPDGRPPFKAPTFQRFTDMQGFLLVDPIHEVDDRGWPNVKFGGSATPSGG